MANDEVNSHEMVDDHLNKVFAAFFYQNEEDRRVAIERHVDRQVNFHFRAVDQRERSENGVQRPEKVIFTGD